jgi:hypothetical protein
MWMVLLELHIVRKLVADLYHFACVNILNGAIVQREEFKRLSDLRCI